MFSSSAGSCTQPLLQPLTRLTTQLLSWMVWDVEVMLFAINITPTLPTFTITRSLIKIFMLLSNWVPNMISFTASDKATSQLLSWITSHFSVLLITKKLVHIRHTIWIHLHFFCWFGLQHIHCHWNIWSPWVLSNFPMIPTPTQNVY